MGVAIPEEADNASFAFWTSLIFWYVPIIPNSERILLEVIFSVSLEFTF